MTMCSTGDLEGLRKIIVKVDVNCSDYDKRTPLHLAAAEGHLEVVELLGDGPERRRVRRRAAVDDDA